MSVGGQGNGFAPTTLGGGAPLFPQSDGMFAGRRAPTNGLPGGSPIPGKYATPVGPVENAFAGGAAGGLPFAASVAAGQIPPGLMQQWQNMQAQNQARILEAFPGARFGTDLAGVLGRESGRSLTDLLAGTESNALGAFQNFANPLLQSELTRTGGAQQNAYRDFLMQGQMPPAISLLLQLAGLGGGSTTTSGRGSNFGAGTTLVL